MDRAQIAGWLREKDPARLRALWQEADATRRRHVGDEVHRRGLVEFSNRCRRTCLYCGIRAGAPDIERYRMTSEEIVACARLARGLGYGTVVLQSGEDPAGSDAEWLAGVVAAIRAETGIAVALSVGERSAEELALWRSAGADRYLVRFETSNPALYRRIHPDVPGVVSNRVALLRTIRALGYEVGSGVMVGIPGQTIDDLAADVALFRELDLDMVGVGPYLPDPRTPLGARAEAIRAATPDEAPASELMTYKMIALTRLVCPRANIPSTTALATVNRRSGRELGLQRGANVVMPNVTPPEYRARYRIYPDKACVSETAQQCHRCMERRIRRIGRLVGTGPGASPNYAARMEPA